MSPPAGVRRPRGSLAIALVCPYSLGRPGGVQGQVVGLARALAERGHAVTVLAPGEGTEEVTWVKGPATRAGGEMPEGAGGPSGEGWAKVEIVGRAVGVRANGSVAPVALSPGVAVRVTRRASEIGAGVVHLHEPLAPVAGYGVLVRHDRPVVATFHRAGESVLYQVARPLTRWALGRIDVACAVSEAARQTAEGAGAGALEVVFNGVDLERFAPVGGRRAEEREPAILFLGRHEPRKGLEVLLEAVGRMDQVVPVWIAGQGPQTEGLRRRYPPSARVTWLGRLSEAEVVSRLSGASVLCAPSRGGESFGMVLLEALAAGCSVVASDIPGYRDAAGAHALLVPPGDPGALAAALDRAVGETAAGRGLGSPEARAAARRHCERWSMARLAETYEAIYGRAQEVFGSRHRR